MKKIIINGRFLVHRVTGVERYAREILANLDEIIQPGEIEMAMPPEIESIPEYKNIAFKKVGKLHNRLWEHVTFPLYVMRKKAISLNLCNVAPLINPGIACLFDVKIKVHPEFFSKTFLIWYNILFSNATRRTKLILTDSESAKKDLINYYPYLNPEKVVVIYPSWQHFQRIRFDECTLDKYALEKDNFYFAMGSMEPNKNFKWIAEVAKKNGDKFFVVAGSINEKVFADGLEFECPQNMKLLGYVSDGEAKTLMRDCKAFLFPTIYEGFGIPPLEAISAGAREIVVSDTEIMHELFEDTVNYIDPKDFNLKITNFQSMSETDAKRILEKYIWEQSAEKLYSLFKEVCL
ncbi:glycosyltransferase family 1 protein [Sporolactobacillus sp. STCC-11]|uniref:glycosyltransferase family 4 protein n=1 Tax=Sporolactobacillus caesalpiniae TaxID=3230362 RepID=UPI003390BAB7